MKTRKIHSKCLILSTIFILAIAVSAAPCAAYWKTIRAINCGGDAVGDFEADNSYSGGGIYETGASISGGSAPEYVYQTERNGGGGDLTYTITGLHPDGFFTVEFHFAEIYWNSAGQRIFNIHINGHPVSALQGYDIFADAGGMNIGIVRSSFADAPSGTITILFEKTVVDWPKCSGLKILEQTVNFADPDLEAAVEAALVITDPTPTEMLALTEFDTFSIDKGITDITGLGYATNLKGLTLFHHQISDISEVAGLTNLEKLELSDNQISDISPLLGLTNLYYLHLVNNQISDISPLSGLTNLEDLSLVLNQISDIFPLSGLTNLEMLALNENQISNISAVSGLTNLERLYLRENQISNISPLTGLTNITRLDLSYNQISDISPLAGLTNITHLNLDYNQISDISSLCSMNNLNMLNLGGNSLNSQAYHTHLYTIFSNNPGMDIWHDLNPHPPTGVIASDGTYNYKVEVTWDTRYTGPQVGSNYRVYRSTDNNPNTAEPISDWQESTSFSDTTAQLDMTYYYFVKGASLRFDILIETDFSTGDSGWRAVVSSPEVVSQVVTNVTATTALLKGSLLNDGGEQCEYRFRYWRDGEPEQSTPWTGWVSTGGVFTESISGLESSTVYTFVGEARNSAGTGTGSERTFSTLTEDTVTLTISSSTGGSVSKPGEGFFSYGIGEVVLIEASIEDSNYVFNGWTGTAVDANKVADSNMASTTVTVDASYTLQANFRNILTAFYVDATNSNDPYEDGSIEHPFGTIQEAIEVVPNGATIFATAGIYAGPLHLGAKNISIYGDISVDPDSPANPIIVSNSTGPVITLAGSQDPNCVLSGLTITGPNSDSGIECNGSSPIVANCVVCGVKGSGIECTDSNALIVNCTITDNGFESNGAGLVCWDSQVTVINSILWNNLSKAIHVGSGSLPVVSYSNVENRWPGIGNMNLDPFYARPGYRDDKGTPTNVNDDIWILGDYHLQSQTGRWNPDSTNWIQDAVNSPCIDAGDPKSDWSMEPVPNGSRTNIGAYGATPQASKSLTEGEKEIFYMFDLDANPNWSTTGDWSYGQPQGLGGANGNPDPNSGYTGKCVYGVNLQGDYRVTVGGPFYLIAGPFDCTDYQQVSVSFARWLNSDYNPFVANTIDVSNDAATWVTIWQTEVGETMTDNAWQLVEYGINEVADGQSSVYLRWGYSILDSQAYPYSGWNIDDIALKGLP